MANLVRGGVAFGVSIFLLVVSGCVDDDPIVTGNRPDAGVAEGGPGISTVIPGNDGPDDDAADCRLCAETLSTDTARGVLCRKNDVGGSGLSSVRVLNALVDCVCYDKCVDECQSYCAGSKNTERCQGCLSAGCGKQLNACLGDKR